MAIEINMPKLSDSMTEGTLVKWHKKVGDEIEIGDIIAEIETDKATMEMEAFDEGTITSIEVQEGDKIPIGGLLAILDGEEVGGAVKEAPAQTAPAAAAEPQKAAASTPAASTTASPAPQTQTSGERIKSSPLARKIAAEKGIDLASLSGTGPGGRIVKADVLAAASGGTAARGQSAAAAGLAAAAKQKSAAASSAPASVSPVPQAQAILPVVKEGDERIELSPIRKIIADRLLTSKQTIPHFYLHTEVDMEALLDLRKQINDQTAKTNGNKYSVNDFILKAAINAAQVVPAVNASFAGDHIVQFSQIGMAVAIAVEEGLVTPVVKDAANKTLLQISLEVKDMAARAKEKKLKPNEFDGGTLTVSNLGAWGIDYFDAIINPPQALIVSVGAAKQKPVVKDGEIAPGLRMDLGISCDHRVIDGAVGAEFLAEMKRLLEKPALMLI